MDLAHLVTLLCVLAPVFALIALGRGLKRLGLLTDAGTRDLHQLVYWIGLPIQLLVQIGSSDVRANMDLKSLAATLGAYWIGFIVTWLCTFRLEPDTRGCVLNGTVRGNGAFIGLPVILLLAATYPQDQRTHLASCYLVLLGVMVPCFNVGAVLGFLLPRHGVTASGMRHAMFESATNPLLAGCAAGILVSLFCPGLAHADPASPSGPAVSAISTILHMIGDLAVPLALLLVGYQMDTGLMRRSWRLLSWITAAKLLALPAMTWAIGRLIGLDPLTLIAAVVLMASPTAMASVPMARVLKADDRLMAAIVVSTTVCAPLSLLLWLAILSR